MDHIRKAELNDLNQLTILFNAYRVFYKKEMDLEAAYAFIQERIKSNDSEFFVSTDDELLTGFVQLYPLFSSTRMKKLWLLNDLYVHPDHRGKGISVALINLSKQLCKETNACGLILETAKSNMIGNNLYSKEGFMLDEGNHYYWDV